MRTNTRLQAVCHTFFLTFVSLYCSCTLAQSVQDANPDDWNGFGHQRNWQAPMDLRQQSNRDVQEAWRKKVGDGRAQVVGAGPVVIVASGGAVPSDSDETFDKILTEVTALSAKDGSELWNYRRVDKRREDQETFGGSKPSPQATPLLLDDGVVQLSFTGILFCLDRESGKERWAIDLVRDFSAEPVQFGFAASPVKCEGSQDFVVLAAGEKGGLIQFSPEGRVRWASTVKGFSYATPTWAELGGQKQWVVVAQDEVVGIDGSGQRLWSSALRETGLTNVPSPLVVNGSSVLVSGQGCQGTQCLHIRKLRGEWQVEELWHNRRLQLFYTNWLQLNSRIVLGCTDQYLAAFDARSGEIIARRREYRDGNLLRTRNGLLVLSGLGELSLLDYGAAQEQLSRHAAYDAVEGKCWVAPAILGEQVFLRRGEELVCYAMRQQAGASSGNLLSNKLKTEELLALGDDSSKSDPVLEIMETFESQGQAAALQLYGKLRSQKKLTVDHRIALAKSAYGEGMKQLATMIVNHAQSDFPDSEVLKKQISIWQGK